MGVFLVADRYTSSGTFDIDDPYWPVATPVPLGNGKIALFTYRAWVTIESSGGGSSGSDQGPRQQLRLLTLSQAGWVSGNPIDLPVTSFSARAATATAEGNILVHTEGTHPTLAGVGGPYVIQVNGDTLTPVVPAWLTATTSTEGYMYSSPEAMTRVPSTNRFWAWRCYPLRGIAHIDMYEVVGTDATVVHHAAIREANTYAVPYLPRRIIPISATEAITVMAQPNGLLRLIHLDATSPEYTITPQFQDISGYPAAVDATLYPGLNHHAEMLLRAGSDPHTLVRLGINWSGSSFSVTSLPITQLEAATRPPDYPLRAPSNAALAYHAGARYEVADGALYVAREFHDNGTDDNWIHITQYELSTGQVLATAWDKGQRDGAETDHLYLRTSAMTYDPGTSQLVWTGNEQIEPSDSLHDAIWSRMATFRLSYVLDDSKRNTRAAFTP